MLNIAHRGASAQAPENTLSAFRKAVALGADGIELDVHDCKSGELMVIHDDTVDRTTNGQGSVHEMTLSELRALRIEKNERIPTLDEVFETLGKNLYYFIEVKKSVDALSAARLIETYIKKGWPASHLMLISFQHEELGRVRHAFPSLAIGASFETLTHSCIAEAKSMGAKAILPHYSSLSQAYLVAAHGAGLKVIPWTVNEKADIARLRAMGVNGIISDYPDRISP